MFSWHIIRSRLVCLALALAGGGAFAQVNATDSAFQRFYAQVTGVGKQTIGYGSGGQLVVGQGVPQISTAGGPVLVDRSVPVLNNSGGQIPTNARVSVPPAVLGRLLVRGLGAASVLGAGIALYDVAQELGFLVEKDGAAVLVEKFDSTGIVCTAAPCWQYRGNNTVGQPWTYDPVFACQRWATTNGNSYVGITGSGASITCRTSHWRDGPFNFTLLSQSAPPQTPTATPSTLQELEDAIAAKSGWPAASRVSQAVADATALQPAEPFPATPEVTGPATSPGTTTTTENPDGSTTTTTTTHNHTYTGPTINTTTQTISSTCTGGSCNTTTTTETPKVEEQPFTMPCGVAGTPPCEVRLDQSGMPPDGGRPFDQASGDVDPQRDSLLSKLSEIEDFELGDWTWTFQLPTGCTALTMFLGVEVNPCTWQAEIHDIMSVIWILTGIAGAFVIFSRAFQ